MLLRVSLLAAGMALLAGAAQAQNNSAPPPPAAQTNNVASGSATDLSCRRQAADESGYRGGDAAGSERATRYADIYYDCLDSAYGPPNPDYAYVPPPPAYYYPPAYPYYRPYYYGPGLGLSFRFGGGYRRR